MFVCVCVCVCARVHARVHKHMRLHLYVCVFICGLHCFVINQKIRCSEVRWENAFENSRLL